MDDDTWRNVAKKGLLPSITSKEDYEDAVFDGMCRAVTWFQDARYKNPSLENAQEIHRLIFQEVTPWAGKPTKVQLMTNGYVTCEPKRIPEEFEILKEQFREGLPHNANPQETCRWVAFAAARWLRIHPFPDGNKRTISVWALTFLQKKLGEPASTEDAVYHKLQESFKSLRKGNLKPFGENLLKAFGISYGKNVELNWDTPHRIAPVFTDSPKHGDLDR